MTTRSLNPAERITMYANYPQALAEEVSRVLRPLKDDTDRIIHNGALSRFITLFPTQETEQQLWENVARAIIETAMQGVVTDGKDSK